MTVMFSQKQYDDYFGGALFIAICCNTKLYTYVRFYSCNLCVKSNFLYALNATIPFFTNFFLSSLGT